MSPFKWNLVLIAVIAGYGSYFLTAGTAMKKTWEYILLQFDTNSTNENSLAVPLRIVRLTQGVYGLNGTINVGKDMDNDYRVEASAYRSPTGTSQYMLIPYKIDETPLYDFMSNFYQKYLMGDLEDCSNLPQFEGAYKGPLAKGELYLHNCKIRTDSWPTYLHSGYYKIIIIMTGPDVRVVNMIIAKVDDKY